MNWAYKIVRTIIVIILALSIGLPAVLYALLSVPEVQKMVRDRGEIELSALLGADVEIGSVNIAPFNRLTLHDIKLIPQPGDTALKVNRLGAGIRLGKLILQRRIVISYAEIIGLEANLHRDSLNGPLNIQPIIDHLKSDDQDKPKPEYDLRINNIVIRRSSLNYDILNAPTESRTHKFNPNHISIRDLRADILVPRISNNDYTVVLRRLALSEQSGFTIESISGEASVTDSGLALKSFDIILPNSKIILGDIFSDYNGWESLSKGWNHIPFDIKILKGSNLYPPDLAAFYTPLEKIDFSFNIDFEAKGTVGDLTVDNLSVNERSNSISMDILGLSAQGLPSVSDLSVDIDSLNLKVSMPKVCGVLLDKSFGDANLLSKLDTIGQSTLKATISISPDRSTMSANLFTEAGNAFVSTEFDGSILNLQGNAIGSVSVDNANLSVINPNLGNTVMTMDFKSRLDKKIDWVKVDAVVDALTFKGYEYTGIATSFTADRENISGELSVADENLSVDIIGEYGNANGLHSCNAKINLSQINVHNLNLTDKYPGYTMSARIDASLSGNDIENLDGHLSMSNFHFTDSVNDGLTLNYLSVLASGTTTPRYMLIYSDILDGRINGYYRIKDIVPAAKRIFGSIFPALVATEGSMTKNRAKEFPVNLSTRFELRESATTRQWLDFFKSPVKILHTVSITAVLDEESQILKASVDAPYLLQKDKFIENTVMIFKADGTSGTTSLDISTLYPTKDGNASVTITADGEDNKINGRLSWDIDRERKFMGDLDLSAYLSENEGGLKTDIEIRPTEMVFNDTVWNVQPSNIMIADKQINVRNFEVSRDNQFVKIWGTASENPEHQICLELLDMNLDYVFETLAIGNAMFGGIASGKFYASNLFSKNPTLETPGLHVSGFKYNFSVLGNADIVSRWNNETQGVEIDAKVEDDENRISYIDGAIYPMRDSLDFKFKADKLPVGFMKPFMEAFTSDVEGYASGNAHLYGTFKYINMTGDILAEDLKLKVDVTNTYYTTTDSIHLTPGNINFGNVILKDQYGHSGRLDGWVKHNFFKDPSFHFQVTDAKDLLCFNVNSNINPVWYGQIFCNGEVFIDGRPGHVSVSANVTTAPDSEFTFVLSDKEEASEYNFLSFHDRDEAKESLLLIVEDPVAANLKRLKEQFAKEKEQHTSTTEYEITINCSVTNDGKLRIISDPVARDEITTRGTGYLVFGYNNTDDEMTLRGTYTISQGDYSFSIQNLIFRPFKIKAGSYITFTGNPLDAEVDIQATYTVPNVSFSDLDESFLQDRDLKSQHVTVNALLMVRGPMQQPEIEFDLEFPGLTSDTYSKVRSIINTEDQMSRQIIYLLSLGRFYTPDYMESTTKGNELVSVASSTLSSQLGSVLGQLSDNWSIAPNIRSDKGDFSDMSVDLALSSYLLDNRLLFNGNFGYRDNSLYNTSNSFVGDFDIEYLLNSSGNIRLKAYNRYNDQNYYVKSALTTQGVGIVFKRDFDNLFSFLRKKKKHEQDKQTQEQQPESKTIEQ